jgi:ABC-type glycerol-3-phosphate transport system substrate-binding protein
MTGNWPLGNDSAVKNIVWPAMQNVFLGRSAAKDAFADAEKKMEREMRRG